MVKTLIIIRTSKSNSPEKAIIGAVTCVLEGLRILNFLTLADFAQNFFSFYFAIFKFLFGMDFKEFNDKYGLNSMYLHSFFMFF